MYHEENLAGISKTYMVGCIVYYSFERGQAASSQKQQKYLAIVVFLLQNFTLISLIIVT